MDGFELKALAAVYGHQPDRIHMQRAGRDLPQVALLGEEHELADPVKRPLNGEARACGAALADKIEELPDGDGAHAGRLSVTGGERREQVGAVEKISCQK